MEPNPPPAKAGTPVTRHLRITGRVQGVGYRWSMAQEAQRLRLAGWVRNRADGSVEALAHGPAAAVQALVDWAQQGPALACVAGVAVSEAAWDGEASTRFVQCDTL